MRVDLQDRDGVFANASSCSLVQNRRGDDAGTSDDEESTLPAQKNSDDMKGGERAEKDGLGEKGDPLDSEVWQCSSCNDLCSRLHHFVITLA